MQVGKSAEVTVFSPLLSDQLIGPGWAALTRVRLIWFGGCVQCDVSGACGVILLPTPVALFTVLKDTTGLGVQSLLSWRLKNILTLPIVQSIHIQNAIGKIWRKKIRRSKTLVAWSFRSVLRCGQHRDLRGRHRQTRALLWRWGRGGKTVSCITAWKNWLMVHDSTYERSSDLLVGRSVIGFCTELKFLIVLLFWKEHHKWVVIYRIVSLQVYLLGDTSTQLTATPAKLASSNLATPKRGDVSYECWDLRFLIPTWVQK